MSDTQSSTAAPGGSGKPSDDPIRRAHLDALPPSERSEAAARYDHRAERETLDEPITDAERLVVRKSIEIARRASVMLDGHESGDLPYRLDRLMARVSRGTLPAHVEQYIAARLAMMPAIAPHEIEAAVAENRQRDRHYLRARYGL